MSVNKYHRGFWNRLYKKTSQSLLFVFGSVGLIFLLIPENVLSFFNNLSPALGYIEAPVNGTGFYLILAVSYMYLVTLLAYLMNKHPENPFFPLLLIHGKTASSILSFGLFFFHGPFLIYLANGFIDGSIALGVFLLFRKARKEIE